MSITSQQRRRNLNFFNDQKYKKGFNTQTLQICNYLKEKKENTKRTQEQILEERLYYTSTR